MKSIDEFKKSVYRKAEEKIRIRRERMKTVRRFSYIAAMLCIIFAATFAARQTGFFRIGSISPENTGVSASFSAATTPAYTTSGTNTNATRATSTTAGSTYYTSTVQSTAQGEKTTDITDEKEYILELNGKITSDSSVVAKSIDDFVSWAIIDSDLELSDLNTALDVSKNWEDEAFFRNNVGSVLIFVVRNTDGNSSDELCTEYHLDGGEGVMYYYYSESESTDAYAPTGFLIVKECSRECDGAWMKNSDDK